MINTVDPVAGSYAIEALTDQIEQGAAALMEELDAAGGTLAAIEGGTIQRQIQDSAYRDQRAVDDGERVVVGMNQFTDDSPVGIDVMRIDPLVEKEQAARVARVRASRDDARWQQTLDAVSRAARSDTNLVPPIIAAVEARSTVGEIADTLRAVFGEHREEGI